MPCGTTLVYIGGWVEAMQFSQSGLLPTLLVLMEVWRLALHGQLDHRVVEEGASSDPRYMFLPHLPSSGSQERFPYALGSAPRVT